MYENEQKIVVDAGPAPRQLKSGALDLALIAAILPAFVGLLGKGTVDEWVAFFERQDVLTLIGGLVALGAFTVRQFWANRTGKKLVQIEAVTDQVVFKGTPEAQALKSQSK